MNDDILEIFHYKLKVIEERFCIACLFNSLSQKNHTCFYFTGLNKYQWSEIVFEEALKDCLLKQDDIESLREWIKKN